MDSSTLAYIRYWDFKHVLRVVLRIARFQILYPIVENKVLRVDSSHAEDVLRIIR